MRRALAIAVAAVLLGVALGQASAAPVLRSPGLRGIPKRIATRPPTAPDPVQLSANGRRPDVLVDAAGTAHIVWNELVSGGPDVTVYCRLPRAATACEIVRRLVPPGADQYADDGDGPRVVAVNDQLVVLSYRYPQPVTKPGPDRSKDGNTLYLWSSEDGGQTFADAGVVGTAGIGGGAVAFGPAANPSIGVVTGVVTGGVTFTAVAGGRFVFRGATLADGDYYAARVAVQDGRPVVAYQDLHGTSYVRTWSGQGDPNDAATWGPPQAVPGVDPGLTVAGGRVYLVTTQADGTGRMLLRDVASGTSVAVSPGRVGNAGIPIGHADGRLSVVWQGTEGVVSGIWLRDRIVPSATPGAPGLISTESGLFRAADALADGGGVVVMDEVDGRIRASAFGTRAPTGRPGLGGRAGGGALPPDVAVACQRIRMGAVEALLQDGCFLAASQGGAKVSQGPLRLNGLEIVPDAGVQVIIDPRGRTIRSTGTVGVLLRAPGLPDITLFRGALQLSAVGKGVGASLISWTDGLFRPNLLGFPLRGDIDVRLTAAGVRIPVSLQLPPAFGAVRGAAVLEADNRRGLALDSLDFAADGVPLGPATMRRLRVRYRASGGTAVGNCLRPPTSGAAALPNEWAGVFELELPPPKTGPAICGSVRFGDGAFRAATFRIDLPYPGIVLFPGVSVTSLGGGLSLTPTEVAGTATLGIIPATPQAALVRLDGTISARLTAPLVLRGAAETYVSGVRVGRGSFTISTDGYVAVRLDSGPEIGPIAVKASLAGFVDGPRRQFSLSAKGQACVSGACLPGGEAVISTKGVAVCLPAPTVPRGGGYAWGASIPAGVDLWLLGCYASDYAIADARQAAVEHAGAPEAGATVPAGMPDVTFRARGDGGVPTVDLIGPGGAVVTPAATVADAPSQTLYVGVIRPQAGRWTVRVRPGSPGITELATSRSMNPPRVTAARVTGTRRARVLRYRARIGAGQGVVFAERGRAGTRVLGAAAAGSRRLAFAPAPGPGGRRRIVALLSQGGLVREEVVVARYVAPPPPAPGRASALRARRAGAGVVVTWRPGAAAAAQRLKAVIGGGQRVYRLLGPRTRMAVVPGVRGRRVTVTVTAVGRDGRAGRPVATTLLPPRPRR